MKIKKGLKWKSIEGPCKGQEFTVTEITDKLVYYKSNVSDIIYDAPRCHFEKYIERVFKYWNEKNKSYKNKKQKLKEQ